jgi:hypothetical protein
MFDLHICAPINLQAYNHPDMQNAFQYYTRFQSARTSMGSLPPFARSIVTLFALPGIICLLLSILAGLVSIFVLLLLTVPVYRVLQAVVGGRQPTAEAGLSENPLVASFFGQMPGGVAESPGRKQVDAKIIDAD